VVVVVVVVCVWMNTSGNDKVLRWAAELLSYNLVVEHIPGKDNVVPDSLSRMFTEPEPVAPVVAGGAGADPTDADAPWAEGVAGSPSDWLDAVAEAQRSAPAAEQATWTTDRGHGQAAVRGRTLWALNSSSLRTTKS
jgi:hypothetical protein